MFKNSKIAQGFKCGRTKISYHFNFGLAPFFLDEVRDSINDCDFFVLMFDECFIKITKSNQLDIHVKFYNNKTDRLQVRYYGSQFLMKGDAETLLKHFLAETSSLNHAKILQLSMDGPAVNVKFHREYSKDR